MIARAVCGFVSYSLLYISYRLIPYADACTIFAATPVFVIVIAFLFLSESCGLLQVILLIITMPGVTLISRPTILFPDPEQEESAEWHVSGSMVALAATVVYSGVYIFLRTLMETPSPVILNAFGVISVALGIPSLFLVHIVTHADSFLSDQPTVPTTLGDCAWLLANGLCGSLAQGCLTLALKLEEAGIVSLVYNSEIVMVFLLQAACLPLEQISWTSGIGAILVMAAVAVSIASRWLTDHPSAADKWPSWLRCLFPVMTADIDEHDAETSTQ